MKRIIVSVDRITPDIFKMVWALREAGFCVDFDWKRIHKAERRANK